VLGLDTGYHSGGMPGLSVVPLVNRIPFLNVDARFDDKMMTWLKETMNTLQRGGVKKPADQLFRARFYRTSEAVAKTGLLNGQEFVWLYGHEHRLTKQVIADSWHVYPRCIGHGGMPVQVTVVNQSKPEILYYDPRQHPIDKNDPNTMVGYNGHVVLIFQGSILTIQYHDIVSDKILFTETFTPNSPGTL